MKVVGIGEPNIPKNSPSSQVGYRARRINGEWSEPVYRLSPECLKGDLHSTTLSHATGLQHELFRVN